MGEVAKTDWLVIWTAVYAIATVVLAGGIILAFLQIREAKRSTQAQIAMDLFKSLRDETTLKQLRNIIYKLPDDYSKAQDEEQKENIEYLISRLNSLGILVEKGIVDRKLTVEAYAGTTSLRCWYKLHKYIKEVRGKRGHFADYFEGYARLSLDHFKRNGIKVIYRKNEGDEEKNLIIELEKKELHPRSFKKIEKDHKTTRE